MEVYINGIAAISPQSAQNDGTALMFPGNRLRAAEPDYNQFFGPMVSRRMGRLVKMSASAAINALKDAGEETTEGIISGTGLGCLEETGLFLKKLTENKEEMLSPAAFIHSTHNTISAQIAHLMQCRGYNSTYVHRNISFENALLDAWLLLKEGEYQKLLVGGADELTDYSFDILTKFGLYKANESVNTSNLYSIKGPGSIAGEGAAYFSLGTENNPNTYGKLLAVETFSFMESSLAASKTKNILEKHQLTGNILLLAGNNGDENNDLEVAAFVNALEMPMQLSNFKHLCGEYPTSSAFACWMGAQALKTGKVPFEPVQPTQDFNNVLVYNRYHTGHQSLILIGRC